MLIDFRDTDLGARDRALNWLRDQAGAITSRRGIALKWEWIQRDPPALCDPSLVEMIEAVAEEFQLRHRRMVSRAYHDSLFMARIAPTTMIFIPCRLGYSHRPDEYSSPEAIVRGTAVLAESLRRLSA